MINVETVSFGGATYTFEQLMYGAIIGTEGADILVGTGIGERMDGRGGDDVVNGRAGNDTLCGGNGENSVNGDGGFDLAVYDVARSGATIIHNANGTKTIKGAGFTDTLSGVELAQFSTARSSRCRSAPTRRISPPTGARTSCCATAVTARSTSGK